MQTSPLNQGSGLMLSKAPSQIGRVLGDYLPMMLLTVLSGYDENLVD